MHTHRLTAFTTLTAAFALITALFASTAQAMLPDSGWYWVQGEPGRGYSIEIQDNKLFFAGYVYEPNGVPVWYVASGTMLSDSEFRGDLLRAAGGACITCPNIPIESRNITTVGSVRLQWTTPAYVNMTIGGVTRELFRFDFSGVAATTSEFMLGEWSTTEGEPGPSTTYYGERIVYDVIRQDNTGFYASGRRTGAIIGSRQSIVGDSNDRKYVIAVIDSATEFNTVYYFNPIGFGRIEGAFAVYRKGDRVPTEGQYFVAQRTKSRALVQTRVGPGVSKRLEQPTLSPAALAAAEQRLSALTALKAADTQAHATRPFPATFSAEVARLAAQLDNPQKQE